MYLLLKNFVSHLYLKYIKNKNKITINQSINININCVFFDYLFVCLCALMSIKLIRMIAQNFNQFYSKLYIKQSEMIKKKKQTNMVFYYLKNILKIIN